MSLTSQLFFFLPRLRVHKGWLIGDFSIYAFTQYPSYDAFPIYRLKKNSTKKKNKKKPISNVRTSLLDTLLSGVIREDWKVNIQQIYIMKLINACVTYQIAN